MRNPAPSGISWVERRTQSWDVYHLSTGDPDFVGPSTVCHGIDFGSPMFLSINGSKDQRYMSSSLINRFALFSDLICRVRLRQSSDDVGKTPELFQLAPITKQVHTWLVVWNMF